MVVQRAKRCKNLDKIRSQFHTIDSLVGLSKKVENVVVIGMLVQQKVPCFSFFVVTIAGRLLPH